MKFSKEEIQNSMLLYAVTDRMWLKDGEGLTDVCRKVLENGATFLQIREKDLDAIEPLIRQHLYGGLRRMGTQLYAEKYKSYFTGI